MANAKKASSLRTSLKCAEALEGVVARYKFEDYSSNNFRTSNKSLFEPHSRGNHPYGRMAEKASERCPYNSSPNKPRGIRMRLWGDGRWEGHVVQGAYHLDCQGAAGGGYVSWQIQSIHGRDVGTAAQVLMKADHEFRFRDFLDAIRFSLERRMICRLDP